MAPQSREVGRLAPLPTAISSRASTADLLIARSMIFLQCDVRMEMKFQRGSLKGYIRYVSV